MAKPLQNTYRLENGTTHIPPDDLRRALEDFEFYMGHYQQITNKRRDVVPFKLNPFQQRLFATVLPMVKKETRADRRRTLLVIKGRQVGSSVGIVALIHYICAYVDGMNRLNLGHVLPVGDTVAKFYQQKALPILTGCHPDLFPTMTRETLSSSIVVHYQDLKGIPRDNYYELISSSASSIRSASLHVVVEDEVDYYRNFERLQGAILPTLPDTGFSLVIYASTVSDKANSPLKDMLARAQEYPDDFTVVFAPWYLSYPEEPQGIDYEKLELNDYEREVIIPAMQADGVPQAKWGDCIDWYRHRKVSGVNMAVEFPTTLQEVITAGQDESVFPANLLDPQRESIINGTPFRLIEDVQTQKTELQSTDASPFVLFRPPVYGHKYRISIDPITSQSDSSDFCVMQVMDCSNNEQVGIFRDRGLSDEQYADWAVGIAKVYNNAQLCPEVNVASGFIVAVNARRYYNWYYQNKSLQKARTPGIRTTVGSKVTMVENLKTMLSRRNIIIHDETTLEELENYVKKVKKRYDGSSSVAMAAKGRGHDDACMALVLYAGSLTIRELEGARSAGWSFL